MTTRVDARTGVAAAALILLGWTLGSLLMPPVARSQEPALPARAPRAATAVASVPRVRLDVTRPRVDAPRVGRNPFDFARGVATMRPATTAPAGSGVEAAAGEVASDAAASVPEWQLAGVAIGADDVVTAVLSGAGGVHLVRAGDSLPGAWTVLEVTAERVRLGAPDGSERTLVLR